MKVLACLSQKGGVGKTTLATSLAVLAEEAGLPTVLLDLDPQSSALSWKDARKPEAPYVAGATPPRLSRLLEDARAQGAKLVILDTAPNSDRGSLAVARASDLILVPCRPSAFDLGAIMSTLSLARDRTQTPTWVVLNAAPVRSKITEEAAEALRAQKAQVCPVVLHQRQDFVTPLAAGLTAVEWAPKGKAAEEARRLWAWAAKHLSLKPSNNQARKAA